MIRWAVRVLLSAIVLVAGLAGPAEAGEVRVLTGPAPVELVRPVAGEPLVAGTRAVVEWTAIGELPLERIEEWEAFLSFDDGGYYAVRLTPHLDLSLRRFTFPVPAVATDRARIMLRFGDEKREVGFEMPGRFTIRWSPVPAIERPLPAVALGEAARPGDDGVVAWVDGGRRGESLEAWWMPADPATARPVVLAGFAHLQAVSSPRPLPALALMPLAGLFRVRRSPRRRGAASLPRAVAILLLSCRQNE